MLNPEYAQERLKEIALEPKEAQRLQKERVAALSSAELRAVAFALIGLDPNGEEWRRQKGRGGDQEEGAEEPDEAEAAEAAGIAGRLNEVMAALGEMGAMIAQALPAGLCGSDAVLDLLGDAKGAKSAHERQRAAADAAAVRLDAMGEDDRRTVFSALHPGLGPALAAAWSSPHELYLDGWRAKPFRAPSRPDLTREARKNAADAILRLMITHPERDAVWLAAWAPYVGGYYQVDQIGSLLAPVIDAGGETGEAVLRTLIESGNGEHETGAMGRHVTRALLSAGRPEGWEWVEKLLLAAQRQEGLRQNVLESVVDAHPEAFRRMLRVIRENDLARFSAVAYAAGQWFGFDWRAQDPPTPKTVNHLLAQAEAFLADRETARAAVIPGSEADAQTTYLALWCLAFDDAPAAVGPITEVLKTDSNPERRYVALEILNELSLPEANAAVTAALDDPDLRVSARAFWSGGAYGFVTGEKEDPAAEWDRLVRNLPRYPKPKAKLGPVVWPWWNVEACASDLADRLPGYRGKRPVSDLLPFLPQMSSSGRSAVASMYADKKTGPKDDAARAVLIRFAADASSYVRDTALQGLERFPVKDEEAAKELEGLLTRKGGDLRRSVLKLLLKQDDGAAVASAKRLLATKPSSAQRAAGLDLLKQMVDKGRAAEEARATVRAYAEANPDPAEAERALLDSLLDVKRETATLDDALGLMDPKNLTPAVQPPLPEPAPALATEAAARLIRALDDWVEANKKLPLRPAEDEDDATEVLLGDRPWSFPSPDWGKPLEEDRARMPIFEQFEAWWANRAADLRDADGLEAVRAAVALEGGAVSVKTFRKESRDALAALWPRLFAAVPLGKSFRHERLVGLLADWAVRLFVQPERGDAMTDLLLDGAQATAALVPASELSKTTEKVKDDYWSHRANEWRDSTSFMAWTWAARTEFTRAAALGRSWDAARVARLWSLLAFIDRPYPGADRNRPALEFVAAAFGIGAATADDVYDLLLGPRSGGYHASSTFDALGEMTARKEHALLAMTPGLREIVDRCRTRVLEVELARGDTETVATTPATALRHAGGADVLARLVGALGKDKFVRNYEWREANRAGVFSRLVRRTHPGPDDTLDSFAERMKAAKVPEQRVVEVAVYAPQWARHAEAMLGWPQLAEAVWWLHAHTKESGWGYGNESEVREGWAAEIAGLTPLTSEDLTEGAVDVAWFRRVRETLGEQRWAAVDDAARYASSAGGHKRAQLYADAMLGKLDEADLRSKITTKRNQDALRALGLLPLPDGDTDAREALALSRYEAIQEFRRGSKQFGSMKQESEKKAARIAMENLARTAGYPDPARLEWAMEARAVADLADGPVSASAGEATATLSIDPFGRPTLAFANKGKPVKALPSATKKEPEIAALLDRRKALERQASRMRQSLEEAMVRGDRFTGAETVKLLAHPMLTPLLRSLVFVADGPRVMGYPVQGGQNGLSLEDCEGAVTPVASDEALRIAHPYDLFHSGRWDRWQRDCFLRERIQPFKQVFRELYLLTDAEHDGEGRRSRRYGGHQVNPSQAYALLGRRGWVRQFEEDEVRRTFHEARLTVTLDFGGWTGTPADIDGLTIDTVQFTRRGEWEAIKLADVPPRLFSEAMRDLDLVVSVAHRGGVDPEASQSTVEMRAAVVREAAALLKLDNVRIERSHVLINGTLGTYSVHLGSAIVHRQPGGFVCIVPVHAQARGRVFLPFLDDDPRTAEVVSKVLMLAKDQEIKDPTILEQIFAVK
jgi:hypothetical protein